MECILKSTIFFLKCLKKSWMIKPHESRKQEKEYVEIHHDFFFFKFKVLKVNRL